MDKDILFREHSLRAAWDALIEARSPKTQGARLALLSKLDDVKIVVDEDPIAQLVDLKSTARRLRCYDEFKHLNDALALSKFANALPPEHDIQRQMLESVRGELRREEVVTTIRARYGTKRVHSRRCSVGRGPPAMPPFWRRGGRENPVAHDAVERPEGVRREVAVDEVATVVRDSSVWYLPRDSRKMRKSRSLVPHCRLVSRQF